jgi:DNA-binding NarL/FixJ family response regulator
MASVARLATVGSMSVHTVLIAARHHGTRDTIRAALDPERTDVVAEARGRWQAGELVRALRPEAAVVDVSLLATREFFLCGWGPVSRETRIVAVGPPDPHLAAQLLAHGAAAYLPLDQLAERLPACLQGAPARDHGASRNGGYSSVTSAKA